MIISGLSFPGHGTVMASASSKRLMTRLLRGGCEAQIRGPVAASSQRVVDCVIVVADLGGPEGAVEQAERTVGDGGGNVTPTAVPDHEADEERDKASEAGSEDDKT